MVGRMSRSFGNASARAASGPDASSGRAAFAVASSLRSHRCASRAALTGVALGPGDQGQASSAGRFLEDDDADEGVINVLMEAGRTGRVDGERGSHCTPEPALASDSSLSSLPPKSVLDVASDGEKLSVDPRLTRDGVCTTLASP